MEIDVEKISASKKRKYNEILEQARALKQKVTVEILKQKCVEFKREEGRASFFDIAMEIVNKHPLQASVIILATWNMERFRFMTSKSQNLVDLENAIRKCKPLFEEIKDKDFRFTNFNEIKDVVKEIYNTFSKVKGVEYTGASKLMHLFNKNLFVMWDTDIREGYGFVFKSIQMTSAEDYLFFQKVMQEIFGNIEWNEPDKTLVKAIDEFNYMTYTFPKLRKRKHRRAKSG